MTKIANSTSRKVLNCSRVVTCSSQGTAAATAVMISDGRIESVGSSEIAETSSDEVHDFTGCTIVPGFVDCHDHLAQDLDQEVTGTVRYESDAVLALRGAKNARVLIASGITTLRNLGDRNPVGVSLRDAIASGGLLGPRMFVSGASICRTGGHAWTGQSMEADGVDGVVTAVRSNLKLGVDCIKLMITSGFATIPTRAEMRRNEVRAGIEEAHAWRRKVAVHCYGGEAADWAIAYGADSLEHGGLLEDEQLEKMAAKGLFLVITTGTGRFCMDSQYISAVVRERIREVVESRIPDTLMRARAAGVKVAIGGDINHGVPSDEMEALVTAGYTPIQAIRAATLAGAELIGIDDAVGSLESGKIADLVVLEGNPLEDIRATSRVVAVMKAGEFITSNPSPNLTGSNRIHPKRCCNSQ